MVDHNRKIIVRLTCAHRNYMYHRYSFNKLTRDDLLFPKLQSFFLQGYHVLANYAYLMPHMRHDFELSSLLQKSYPWPYQYRNCNYVLRIARRYAAGCAGRKKIVNVFEGEEPIGFTGFFQAWQKDYDPNAKFDSMQGSM